MNDWCEEAGGGIEMEFLYRDDNTPDTVTHLDENNKYWVELQKALTDDLYDKLNQNKFLYFIMLFFFKGK